MNTTTEAKMNSKMFDMNYSAGDMIFNKKIQLAYAFCKIVGCFSGKPMLGERGWAWKRPVR